MEEPLEEDEDEAEELFDADPTCEHDVRAQQSGVKCSKCSGWFCY